MRGSRETTEELKWVWTEDYVNKHFTYKIPIKQIIDPVIQLLISEKCKWHCYSVRAFCHCNQCDNSLSLQSGSTIDCFLHLNICIAP